MSPLSNATSLANYASGIGTQGATLEIQTANKRVGIGTTNPQGPAGSLQVGTAVTISGNSGIVSATTFHGDFGSSTSVAGNLSVSGVLTYEDVTNIDSVGIVTARSGVSVPDGQKILLGTSNDLEIFHDGNHSRISDDGPGALLLESDGTSIQMNKGTTENMLIANIDGSVDLYYDNSKKFETTSGGVNVTGTGTFSSQVSTSDRFDANRSNGTDNVFNGRLNNALTSSILANGSATFAGDVDFGPYSESNAGSEGAVIRSSGFTQINRTSDIAALQIRQSGIANITLNAGGSATFAGNINVGSGTVDYGSSNITGSLLAGGAVFVQKTAADNSSAFAAYKGANSTPTYDVKADGSVSFASGNFAIDADGEISTNVKSAGHIELDSTGSFSSPKIKLFANTGAATFAGNLNVSGFVRGGASSILYISDDIQLSSAKSLMLGGANTKISNDGIACTVDILSTESVRIDDTRLRIYSGAIDLNYNGTAEFAGDVTVSSTNADSNSATSSKLKFGLSNVSQTAYLQTSAGGSGGPGGFGGNLNFYVKGDATNPFVKALELNYLGNATFAGTVLIGTTQGPGFTNRLLSIGDTSLPAVYQEIRTSNSGVGGIVFSDGTAANDSSYRGIVDYAHSIDEMRLYTSATPKVRIQGDGTFRIQPAGATTSANMVIDRNGDAMRIKSQKDGTGSTELSLQTQNTGALNDSLHIYPYGLSSHYSSSHANQTITTAPSGTSSFLYRGHYSGGTVCFTVWSSGAIENTTGSVGTISDVKLKENIVDAPSQWDDIKAVKFRKFNFKEETGHETHTQLGVVAQEIELISPGLVYESPDQDVEGKDLGTTTKSVKTSILTMKSLVALQEAMKRIETLETQNADLLARVTALEG